MLKIFVSVVGPYSIEKLCYSVELPIFQKCPNFSLIVRPSSLYHVCFVTNVVATEARKQTGNGSETDLQCGCNQRSEQQTRNRCKYTVDPRGSAVERQRSFAVLRSTCSLWVTTYVGKPSAIGQPTRPTLPFILSGSINE